MTLLVLSFGSAESPNSWSGVPYNTVAKLRSIGIACDCIDVGNIFGLRFIRRVYNYLHRLVYPRKLHSFSNTRIGLQLMNYWLRVKLYWNRKYDAVLAFSYSVDGQGVRIPLILVHDWTTDYQIVTFWHSVPTLAEHQQSLNTYRAMGHASSVISLYPAATKFMNKKMSGGKKVEFICNPVNIGIELCFEEVEKYRLTSKRILLIGGEFYRDNVEMVVNAVNLTNDPEIVIDVIGINSVNTKTKNTVHCYGYLSKQKKEELTLYTELMSKARVFVNVREGWGGGSSIAEAMYNYLPVIIGRYPDIEKLYGTDIPFGYYSKPGDVIECAQHIRDLMSMDSACYKKLCKNAHILTQDQTYDNFVNRIVKIIAEK